MRSWRVNPEESVFFFEKKNQKTFGLWLTGSGDRIRRRAKVFCFFSSEKKTFLHHATPDFQPPPGPCYQI
jgi:hypothetical protein